MTTKTPKSIQRAYTIGRILGMIAEASNRSLGHYRWMYSGSVDQNPEHAYTVAMRTSDRLRLLVRHEDLRHAVECLALTLDPKPCDSHEYDLAGMGALILGRMDYQLGIVREALGRPKEDL